MNVFFPFFNFLFHICKRWIKLKISIGGGIQTLCGACNVNTVFKINQSLDRLLRLFCLIECEL